MNARLNNAKTLDWKRQNFASILINQRQYVEPDKVEISSAQQNYEAHWLQGLSLQDVSSMQNTIFFFFFLEVRISLTWNDSLKKCMYGHL
jgi:hypothetical protein